MINYSIYDGDDTLVSKSKRNAIGLASDGTSNKGDMRVEARFIYVQAGKDLRVGDVIFFNNDTGLATNEEINNRPAIMLKDIKNKQYGWALLGGLYQFTGSATSYGGNLYVKDGRVTTEENDNSLLGSYFIDNKGLAYIKD